MIFPHASFFHFFLIKATVDIFLAILTKKGYTSQYF